MVLADLLREGHGALLPADTDTPHLDVALLLAHTLGISRETLYMNLREPVEGEGIKRFRTLIRRRKAGEPVAWIIGVKEFWGLEFQVGPGVLCPRQDSETLVEAALAIMPEGSSGRLHDCCCGPGTIGIALASERMGWHISASDISDDAKKYFRLNNEKLTGSRVHFIQSDLLEGLSDCFDIIVANPPYLRPEETAERRALGWREPPLALDGGDMDGLGVIRRLIPQAAAHLQPGSTLLLEADPRQMPVLRTLLQSGGFHTVTIRRDLGGRDRVISGILSRAPLKTPI
ncbi:MAG: protein-(glutamine-N5) methyltransferase, release factor-specific [Spirochaeta sp. LUC14_002_19_P3]|nr:MAG: protein-(glutamine-N5) methyltransferase, release factor-specific [Spirochaeta sp. LUC14_002_19_P3]